MVKGLKKYKTEGIETIFGVNENSFGLCGGLK